MEKDALTAGVEPVGGLFSTADIKILICYILSSVNESVSASMLSNLLHYEGIANAFEVSDSIMSLYKNGMLEAVDSVQECFVITDKGREIASTLKNSLSFTVRERACSAALKMMGRIKNARNTEIKVLHENESTYLSCAVVDDKQTLLSFKLLVADDTQAMYIKERFLDHTSEIYSQLIELITKYDD